MLRSFILAFLFIIPLNGSAFCSEEGKESSFYDFSKGALRKKESYSKLIAFFLLPEHHPSKAALDTIFSTYPNAIENIAAFQQAGFITLFQQPSSYIFVASHPFLSNYLLKGFLDTEKREKENKPGWKWLVDRCVGAYNVRRLIARHKLKHFVVPDKWLYDLSPFSSVPLAEPKLLLLVTDMKLAGHYETVEAWKNATKEQLDELYCILSHGYASAYLIANMPYTKEGKFACIDTEHPKRKVNCKRVKTFLSAKMGKYWDHLMKTGGKKLGKNKL